MKRSFVDEELSEAATAALARLALACIEFSEATRKALRAAAAVTQAQAEEQRRQHPRITDGPASHPPPLQETNVTPPEPPGTPATPNPHPSSRPQAPQDAPGRATRGRTFTETEDALILTHWPNVHALKSLLNRASSSLYRRATRLGVHEPRRLTTGTTGSAMIYWPSRRATVAAQLHQLAETPNLTLAEYKRRKHEITHTEP